MVFITALGIKVAASTIVAAAVGAAAAGMFATASLRPRPSLEVMRCPKPLVQQEEDSSSDELDFTEWSPPRPIQNSHIISIQLDDPERIRWREAVQSQQEAEEDTCGSGMFGFTPGYYVSRNLETSESKTHQKHEDDQHNNEAEEGRSEMRDQNQQGGGGQQEGGSGGGGSDSEDQSSDEEDEESDSGESDGNKKQKTKRNRQAHSRARQSDQNQGHICRNNERSSNEIDQNTPAAILIGVLNVRSLNKKVMKILALILKKKLDVFCTTETWLNENTGAGVLRRASPEDFRFYYQTRPSRGGGAAVQVRQVLQSIPIYFRSKITTFEVAATILQHETWPEPVLVISLYHRGSRGTRHHQFLDEFHDVLCEIFDLCNNMIVTGDFNIWIDDLRRGRMFRWLLQAYELDQHVREATHNRGRTLDLVITRNIQVSRLSIEIDGISDHYSVYFSARPESTNKKRRIKQEEENNKNAIKKKKE